MAVDLIHPGADPNCRSCGGMGLCVVRDGEHAVARPCRCVRTCPKCQGTGLVADSAEFRAPRRRCSCQVAARRADRFDAIGIPARHVDSTRSSFVPADKRQIGVLAAVSNYLKDYDPTRDNRGLVLWGDVGRGKTHLLVAILRELVFRYGVGARFVEFSHLLADLKSSFDGGGGAAALLDPLVQVDVLAIDELGKGRNTEFEGTVIDELVSRRYNALRPILATTNFPPKAASGRAVANAAEAQLGATASLPSLADRLGDRVWSRLRETCDFVEVKGEDHRLTTRRPPSHP
jgi:DNA replication protein DnaC